MKAIRFNTATVIAEILCELPDVQLVTKPIYDYPNGKVYFKVSTSTYTHEYELHMIDLLKLHDYKLTQYAYSLVREFYEEKQQRNY